MNYEILDITLGKIGGGLPNINIFVNFLTKMTYRLSKLKDWFVLAGPVGLYGLNLLGSFVESPEVGSIKSNSR